MHEYMYVRLCLCVCVCVCVYESVCAMQAYDLAKFYAYQKYQLWQNFVVLPFMDPDHSICMYVCA